ncbi:MAG: DUF4153 domain-containing protein, partial [Flavobacteriaceae bacterium]|nr:DUF4153 domain-containing protein [Flavobacteriaceae bacterium]
FLFFWHLPNTYGDVRSVDYWIRFALYLLAGHLFVLFAPFVFKYGRNSYWNYLRSVFLAIFRSLLYTMVLYLGIVLALLAIKYLFNVDFHEKRFFQVFVLCIGIVNTWIYLSDFPREIHTATEIDFIKALEVLVKYILIPLVILYIVILYAYSLKIVIQWELPKGWVSYLVTALAFLGFFIQLLIDPVQKKQETGLLRKFQPWFYFLLLPLLVLLFVAIFTRISDYGFTENRYFVLALAFWITGIAFYMLLSRQKQVRYFAMSLALLILLISFGPWGAFSVSAKSQLNQFAKIYSEIKAKDFKITSKENEQFTSIVRYLFEKKQLDKVKPILGFNPTDKFNTKYAYQIANDLRDTLKVQVIYDPKTDFISSYRTFNLDQNKPVDIKGFDLLKWVRFNNAVENRVSAYAFQLDSVNNIAVYRSDSLIETVNLNDLVRELPATQEYREIPPYKMTVNIVSDSFNARILFKEISLDNSIRTKDSLPVINWASAYILIKEHAEQN